MNSNNEKVVELYGFNLSVSDLDRIEHRVLTEARYERAEISLIVPFLLPGTAAIDIGANIGIYSLFMIQFLGPNGRVLAFEPFPINYNRLVKNIRLNEARVEAIPYALGDRAEQRTIQFKEQYGSPEIINYGGLYIPSPNKNGNLNIDIRRLDDVVVEYDLAKISFLKIDVEGWELKVLSGARETLHRHKPTILIEILDRNNSQEPTSHKMQIVNFLQERNYTIYRIFSKPIPFYEPLQPHDLEGQVHFNALCIHQSMFQKGLPLIRDSEMAAGTPPKRPRERVTDMVNKARNAFDTNDVDGLRRISERLCLQASQSWYFLGDLLRQRRKLKEAVQAYEKSYVISGRTNASPLYGLCEAYGKLKDCDSFQRNCELFLSQSKPDANIYSRIMLVAGELKLRKLLDRLIELTDPIENKDARYWVRRATAEYQFGDRNKVRELSRRALELDPNNKDLKVELSALDYDVKKYWEIRYKSSQGERTPVPVTSQSDEAYQKRIERDCRYLDEVFTKLFGPKKIALAAECGCGSGRMTPFLRKWSSAIDCFDISPTAITFAKRNGANMTNVTFTVTNLATDPLPSAKYDLLFDLFSVQHVSNPVEWEAVLANYAQACTPGGFICLVEIAGNDEENFVPHVRNASPESYEKKITSHGYITLLRELTPWREMCAIFQRI